MSEQPMYAVEVVSDQYKRDKVTGGTVRLQSGIVLDWRVTHKYSASRPFRPDYAATHYFNHGKPVLAKVVDSNNPGVRSAIFKALYVSVRTTR
jgi:hypothetical protein